MSASLIQHPPTKPDIVTKATKMLFLGLAIGPFRSLLAWSHISQMEFLWAVILTMALTLAIMIWLIYKMDQGRNWARIALLILFLLEGPFSILPLVRLLSDAPISATLGLIQFVIKTVAFFMLFSVNARSWFRRSAPSSVSQSLLPSKL